MGISRIWFGRSLIAVDPLERTQPVLALDGVAFFGAIEVKH